MPEKKAKVHQEILDNALSDPSVQVEYNKLEGEFQAKRQTLLITKYRTRDGKILNFREPSPQGETNMGQDWYKDIEDFHKAFGHHIGTWPTVPPDRVQRLRRKLIREEVNELLDGIDDNDLVKVADGCADSIVVILGTAISYGIDLRPIWDEVHRSNMAKVGGGKRPDGKTLKPEGWKPPDIKGLINKQKGD